MSNTPDVLSRLLTAFQAVREERSRIKHEYEKADSELQRKLNLFEAELLRIMNETGCDQLKVTGVGLAYRADKQKFHARDWPTIWKFIEENNMMDLLQRRLAVGTLREYMDEHEGALPPGIDVSTERAVTVKRA